MVCSPVIHLLGKGDLNRGFQVYKILWNDPIFYNLLEVRKRENEFKLYHGGFRSGTLSWLQALLNQYPSILPRELSSPKVFQSVVQLFSVIVYEIVLPEGQKQDFFIT